MTTLTDLRNIRLEKLTRLKKLGINSYPSQSKKDHSNKEITQNFNKFNGKKATLAGRIISWREHSGLAFADLSDQSGKIQLYIKKDNLEETNAQKQTIGFSDLKLLDIGDFVEALGKITKTQRGEISLEVAQIKILAKSLRPLPEKWEGLKDPEIIFRRRYLDLAINEDRREMFVRKAKFWEVSREFMKKKGFMEVETPILELVTGGADAKPFVTHHNTLDQDFFLRISAELYEKRLIGGGFEKIFVLGPNFRNEGIDDEHLQEYYQLEWYWAYADYKDNMNLVKELFQHIAKEVYGKTKFKKDNHEFDLSDKWKEIDYVEKTKERFGIDIFDDSEEKMIHALKKENAQLPKKPNRQRLCDALWKIARKEITGPAFLVNEPKFVSPLAKSQTKDERLTERFHVIIAGSELGNGYSELNDPIDQLKRFKEQQKARDTGDEEAQMLDLDYVEMLEYGMPPTTGYGQSERVFWFLEGITAREGTLFPQMRYKLDETTKKLYDI
jgi:lysyl-tRNA synthetase class 2